MFPPHVKREVCERLALAGCVAPDDEADELLAYAPDAATLDELVVRREHGEPLAWIVGRVTFLGTDVVVDLGVYVPRAQSEELARRAGEALNSRGAAVELCAGAGAIAVHLGRTRPGARVVACDIDPRAVACAQRNGVAAVVTDMEQGLRSGAFDVVCGVTPYVPTGQIRLLPRDVVRYEPRRALDGGVDGLDVVRRLAVGARRLLRPGGWLFTELGGDQDGAVEPLLADAGFDEVAFWRDEEGDLRGVSARRT